MDGLTVDLIEPAALIVELPEGATFEIETLDTSLTVVLSQQDQGPPGSYELKTHTVESSANTVLNYLDGAWQLLHLIGNVDTLNVINWPATAGARLVIEIVSEGDFSIDSWGAATRWTGGSAPLTFQGDSLVVLATGSGGTRTYANVVGQNYTIPA